MQTDASYNAVPVSLGLVGYAVRIRSDIDFFDTIIHPDGDSTFSGTDITGYIILMGNAKTILHSCLLSVHPYGCFYMGTFQKQQNTFTFPVGRYIHLFLIPSSSYIMFVGSQKEWKFNITFFTVFFHVWIIIVGTVIETACPLGLCGNLITFQFLGHGTGQVDEVIQSVAEPFFLFSIILTVYTE